MLCSGDILIVDQSLEPLNNLTIVSLDGQYKIVKISVHNSKRYLIHEGASYRPIEISKEMKLDVWGVITYIIHKA